MGLPVGFPIYPDNIVTGTYNVSLAIPLPVSEISKAVGVTAGGGLLLPNVDFLVKFIQGNIGIGESMIKSMLEKNFASPIMASDPKVFKSFAKSTNIPIDNIDKYKKPDGKLAFPKSEISLAPEWEPTGLIALEKTMLKSIFETQKPYLEIAQLTIGNIAKIEDIIARIMPLLSANPLKAKSKKPVGNSGSGTSRPKAIGFQGGKEIKDAVAKLSAVSKKDGFTTVGPNGEPQRQVKNPVSATQSSESSDSSTDNGNTSETQGGTWKVISTVYSTGEFIPTINYEYKYIDLPADTEVPDVEAGIDLSIDDPFQKFKPPCIIFGIYDSKGSPLNPEAKLQGFSNQGNLTTTTIPKADWILQSPKWKFPTPTSVWPAFGKPYYIWKRYPGETKEATEEPATGEGQPNWEIKRYEEGEKNRINGRDAIPGDPVITRFEPTEENEFRKFFNELATIRMTKAEGLTQQEKNESVNEIMNQVDVRSHLENTFLYGQAKSSVYTRLQIPSLQNNNPFPDVLRRSFKPYRIFSQDAVNDADLKKAIPNYNGQIWVDPESDYLSKVIRVDPTTKIEYKKPGTGALVSAEIRAFVKNAVNIRVSDGGSFNILVRKKNGNSNNTSFFTFDSLSNTTNYYLENWNYNDQDGLLLSQVAATFSPGNIGQRQTFATLANSEPVRNDQNEYRVSIWRSKASPEFDNLGYAAWKSGGDFVEIEKQNEVWSYNKFGFNFSVSNDYAFSKLKEKLESTGGVEIETLYNLLKANPSATYEFDNSPTIPVDKNSLGHVGSSLTSPPIGSNQGAFIELSAQVALSSGTGSVGDISYLSKYAKSITLRRGKANSLGQQPEYTFIIKSPGITYNSSTKVNKIFIENAPSGFSIDANFYIKSIKYSVPISILFSRKISTTTTGNVRLEYDGSVVEVVNNVIKKWYLMTPSDLTLISGNSYKNGDLIGPSTTNLQTLNNTIETITNGTWTNKPLVPNGYVRDFIIHPVRNANNNKTGLVFSNTITPTTDVRKPVILSNTSTLNQFQLRVENKDGSTAIIDPSQITNDQLKTDQPFSTGKYGHGSDEDPQKIEVIKRYMRTEFDTESYYIIEGILPEIADRLGATPSSPASTGSGSGGGGGGGGGGYYKLPDAIGAIKVFIMMLVDVFAKLIPAIKKLIKLFQNPPSFVTDIITEKLEENFTFLNKQSQAVFKQAAKMKEKIPKVNSRKAPTPPNNIPGAPTPPGAPSIPPAPGAPNTPATPNLNTGAKDSMPSPTVDVDMKQLSPSIPSTSDQVNLIKKQVSTLRETVKKSPLSNYVYVADDGKLVSVFDGVAEIPFGVFGNELPAPATGMGLPQLKLPFGIEFKLGNLPKKSPFKLIFNADLKTSDFKTIDDKLKGDDNALGTQEMPIKSSDIAPPSSTNAPAGQPNLNLSQQNGNNNKDTTQIKFEDGTSVFVKDNLVNDFIKNNSSRYNFVYVNEDIANKIREADALVEKGSPEDLAKAKGLYDEASKAQPNNQALKDKISGLDDALEKFKQHQHPLLKLLLGMVTLPIKMISGIIEYIMAFFKMLTNPMKLPSAMVQFLSFSWMVDLLKPTGLLALAGVKFKPEKLPEWAALSFIPNPLNKEKPPSLRIPPDVDQKGFNPKKAGIGGFAIPDDFKIADMSEFLNVAFNNKLPQLTALQNRQGPFLYLRVFFPLLCLIEKIINGLIDFIWSTLGIEAVIPPPHIKLCKDLDDSLATNDPTNKPKQEDIEKAAQILNGFDPAKANDLFSGKNDADLSAFIYEVKMPTGEVKQFLNRQELDRFIEKNKDIAYEFNF